MSDLSGRIVVVEDNDDDVFVMQRGLKKAEITNPVVVLSDGQAAFDYFTEMKERVQQQKEALPLLIFLDLKLPYMTGFELLAWIQQEPVIKPTPVVILTSSAEERDYQRAFAL